MAASGHELLFRLSEARRAEQPKGLLDDLRVHVLAIDLGLMMKGSGLHLANPLLWSSASGPPFRQ